MTDPNIQLGDGIEGLRALGDTGTVDLVLSDLPSGVTEAEFDHAPDLAALFAATWHALKPDGIAVFMASHLPFAAACMAAGGKAFRYELVWEKSMATGHMQGKQRPMRAHEFVLVFSREVGFFSVERIDGFAPMGRQKAKAGPVSFSENYAAVGQVEKRAGATDRNPRSVLRFNSVPRTGGGRIHPQQKPVDLLRWLVRSYSRPGEIVVDPFAGSGSTGVAALAEGREFVGFDTSPRFAPRGYFAQVSA